MLGSVSSPLDSLFCALAVIVPFFIGGLFQTVFLKHPVSDRFATPIDRGANFLGQPLFGANKTWRGFVVLIPVTTMLFTLTGAVLGTTPAGVWHLSLAQWFLLGFSSVLGYSLGELPNSFIKRRLGIAPGEPPESGLGRKLALVVDQLDSIVAALFVIGLLVPTDGMFWLWSVTIGGVLHYGFNILLYAIGLKSRAACEVLKSCAPS